MSEVIVIGGGVAGCAAALELAERGYQVKLIEQSSLGSGASGRNPGRMGHGFHYVDVETAKMYFRASIQVQRKYPNYLIGKEHPLNHPLRHGRFFITKDSDNSPKEILVTYAKIREEYRRLIANDPANEVFGPPDHLYRILHPSEYKSFVNTELVEMGVETSEHLFDLKTFFKDFRQKLLIHQNITVYEQTQVVRIERGDVHQKRFKLYVKEKLEDSSIHTFQTDYLVNSTWQHIELLNDSLGLSMVPGARTNRLKALLVVKLPNTLLNAHSMFFCMGQHCMFSNLGNGYGMMTFAETTNMETSSGLTLSAKANRLLEGSGNADEKKDIAQRILAGVTHYIPEMAKAQIVDVKFGIVQTVGKLTLNDLHNPMSSFHKRDYDGIREEQVGLISNPCMKLFYFVRNGQVVSDMVDAAVEATVLINQAVLKIVAAAMKMLIPFNPDLLKAFKNHLDRSTNAMNPDPFLCTGMIQTLFHKQALMQELKGSFKGELSHQHQPLESVPISTFYLGAMRVLSNDWVATLLLSISFATLAIGSMVSIPFAIAAGVTAGLGVSFFSGGGCTKNTQELLQMTGHKVAP